MLYDPEAIHLTFNSANVCEIWGPRKVNVDITIFWVVGLLSRVACWKPTKLHGVAFQIYIYVTITDSPVNLLNAKLNPSCKSQLAEFFWVGI